MRVRIKYRLCPSTRWAYLSAIAAGLVGYLGKLVKNEQANGLHVSTPSHAWHDQRHCPIATASGRSERARRADRVVNGQVGAKPCRACTRFGQPQLDGNAVAGRD